MIRMSVESLEPGMVIAKAVYGNNSKILLNSDVVLNKRFIKGLKDREIAGVFIRDGVTDDIIPEDSVSEVVRGSTIKKMSDIFNSIKDINIDVKKQSAKAVSDIIASDHYQEAINNNPSFSKITNSVTNIVNEIINNPSIVLGMNSLKTYSDYAFQHSTEVAITSVMIGRKIGMSAKRLQELGMGSLMMDIGNIFIPKEIINKPGKLTKEEFNKVKDHPVIGYEILKGVQAMGVLPPHVAFQHHEKQDGSGYPRGISGNNSLLISDEPKSIHLYASIAAVADVYDALSSDTPYRKAFPREKVINMMRKFGGTNFNKEVLKTFLSITPVFPEGSTVKVTMGKYKNSIGVVTAVNKDELARPEIRLFMTTKRKVISPVTLNLKEEKLIKIESVLL
ncbi:HD-GYP domain-containing protein [Candidatus Latescibacterota bacterium]